MEGSHDQTEFNVSSPSAIGDRLDFLVIVSALLSVTTVLLNLLTGVTLLWNRSHYTTTFLLAIGNLALSNLLYGCVGLPIRSQLISTGNRWNYSFASCLSIMTLTDIFEDVSTLSLVLVNLDCTVLLMSPHQYRTGLFRCLMATFSASAWAVPMIVELYLHVKDWNNMKDIYTSLSDVCVGIITKYLKVLGITFTTLLAFPLVMFFIFLQYVKLTKIYTSSPYGAADPTDMLTSLLWLDIVIAVSRFFGGLLVVACLLVGATSRFLAANPFPTSLYIGALWMKKASFGLPMLLWLFSKTIRRSVKQLVHGDTTYFASPYPDSHLSHYNQG
ncbi:unnamed protein product [Acanthosepion pharaonis]|uniref:G-protein coupled receptors family 1 profile domain-containing protein n=1 Tax=Acanthosepion pharaonis TaxID=158019 RepID=A0A812DR32_ACAPH|nr:unnamed protein product [Sepia pharaonis]